MTRPSRRKLRPSPEPCTQAGEVLLTHNHIMLLHGLFDRPGGVAPSCNDWLLATMPYKRRFWGSGASEWGIRRGMRTMHDSWVEKRWIGGRIQWSLTDRGLAILELRVPARVRGSGRYQGLAVRRGSAR